MLSLTLLSALLHPRAQDTSEIAQSLAQSMTTQIYRTKNITTLNLGSVFDSYSHLPSRACIQLIHAQFYLIFCELDYVYIHPSNHTFLLLINIANRHISIVTCLSSHGAKVRHHIISGTSLVSTVTSTSSHRYCLLSHIFCQSSY